MKKIFIFLNKISNYLNAHIIGLTNIIFYQEKNYDIKIKKPIFTKTRTQDNDLFIRLFDFYKKMKENENDISEVIKPSSLWKSHINNDYKYLLNAYKNDNLNDFSFFLSNFGNWDNYLGIEHNILLKRYSKNFLLRNFISNEIFLKHLKIWKDFGYTSEDLSKISTPEFGNQLGAYINGNFVTIGSFFNQVIAKLLHEHIKVHDKPIICDLGGGYGKLGYFLIKNIKKSCFIDFDIPEVLVLAAFYLMKTFPNKKTLLYGEKKFDEEDLSNFELIFMPASEIDKLKENSVNLFVNKNSLGEMRSETAKYYIEKINFCSKIFFHMNHNRIRNNFAGNEKSLISSEYPINYAKFDLIFDYPDLSHFIYTGRYNSENDIFMKLFKIKSNI